MRSPSGRKKTHLESLLVPLIIGLGFTEAPAAKLVFTPEPGALVLLGAGAGGLDVVVVPPNATFSVTASADSTDATAISGWQVNTSLSAPELGIEALGIDPAWQWQVDTTLDHLAGDDFLGATLLPGGSLLLPQDLFTARITSPTALGDYLCSVAVTNAGAFNTGFSGLAEVVIDDFGDFIVRVAPSVDIAVERPAGVAINDGDTMTLWASTTTPGSATYTIRNSGTGTLTGLAISLEGPDAEYFAVTNNPAPSIAMGESTTFTILFSPTNIGTRIAAIHIANNVPGKNPFDITLSGQLYSDGSDRDGDGIGDALEFDMAALGFDPEVNQPALVTTYYAGASRAGLYTQGQYDASFATGRITGQNDVINSPNSYDLYALSQVQSLNMGTPLLTRDAASGKFKLIMGVNKTTSLAIVPFTDFPMNGIGMTTTINPQGKLEFVFPSSDNAAFFRVQAGPGSSAFGNAISLDGVNQYVTVPETAASAVSSPMTIEAWVYVRAQVEWARLMDFGTGAGSNNIVCVLSDGTSGHPSFYFFNEAGAIAGNLVAPAALPLNVWTHLAFTCDGVNGSIYINGSLAVSGAMPAPPSATRNSNFIGRSNFGNPDANAIIDEFRLWSVARTPAQIQTALGTPIIGSEAGLQLYYRFDGASATVAPNSATATGAAYDGTLINNPASAPGPSLP